MSSSQSVGSTGTGDRAGPSSPIAPKKLEVPASPSVESVGATSVIEPKNPFDELTDIPSMPSLSNSGSGTESLQVKPPVLVPNTNAMPQMIGNEQLNQQIPMANAPPATPDRSVTSSPQHPTSPIASNHLMGSSPLMPVGSPLHKTSVQQQSPVLPNVTIQHQQQQQLQQHPPVHSFPPSEHRAPMQPPLPASPHLPPSSGTYHPRHPAQVPRFPDDDDNTEPSSAANTSEQGQPHHRQVHSNQSKENAGTFARLVEKTRKRLSSKDVRKDSMDDDDDMMEDGALICGYLQKYGRNGKWQTRWFETDGECLSYYKNSKRTKLLATLDLKKVGTIEVDPEDPRETAFNIQVLGRMYHLRADSRAACKDWVITLNRVREARLQQGNVKLVKNNIFQSPLNLLDNDKDNMTPRIVVVANRQRTRAVDEDDQWDHVYQEDPTDPAYIEQRRLTVGTTVVGRWSKRHSSLQRLGTKLSKWARSVKKYSCQDVDRDNLYLDRHVHPPGHDDKRRSYTPGKQNYSKGPSTWIAKELVGSPTAANAPDNLALQSAIPKPNPTSRQMSTASEDYSRMIS